MQGIADDFRLAYGASQEYSTDVSVRRMLGVLGVDPVHYYIVLTAFIGMGMLTPPVCIGLYTSSAVIRLSPEQAFRALPPFLLLGICYGLLMILFPALATWLPGLFGLGGA